MLLRETHPQKNKCKIKPDTNTKPLATNNKLIAWTHMLLRESHPKKNKYKI